MNCKATSSDTQAIGFEDQELMKLIPTMAVVTAALKVQALFV
jgi:hypothetical protein